MADNLEIFKCLYLFSLTSYDLITGLVSSQFFSTWVNDVQRQGQKKKEVLHAILYASTTKVVVPSGTLHYSTLLRFFSHSTVCCSNVYSSISIDNNAHHRTIICCSTGIKSFYFIIIYFYHCSLL